MHHWPKVVARPAGVVSWDGLSATGTTLSAGAVQSAAPRHAADALPHGHLQVGALHAQCLPILYAQQKRISALGWSPMLRFLCSVPA